MEQTNSSESLRLLTEAHTISWSASDKEQVPWQHPLERTLPRCHGWIQGHVQRNGNHFVMSLQAQDKTHPILVAEKQSRNKYTIHRRGASISSSTGHDGILGSLSKTTSSSKESIMTYSLLSDSQNQPPVALIRYEVPSVMQVLKDAPPRRAQVLVPGRSSIAVETKEPFSKSGGKCGLDFRSRGREPSRKNMQLQDGNGKVLMQMAKWDKDEFHVDFARPFGAFHAFGFALAQFDL